jgi:hypothetical protein
LTLSVQSVGLLGVGSEGDIVLGEIISATFHQQRIRRITHVKTRVPSMHMCNRNRLSDIAITWEIQSLAYGMHTLLDVRIVSGDGVGRTCIACVEIIQ